MQADYESSGDQLPVPRESRGSSLQLVGGDDNKRLRNQIGGLVLVVVILSALFLGFGCDPGPTTWKTPDSLPPPSAKPGESK